MKAKKTLQNRVRGWFPKEPNTPQNRIKQLNFASPPKIIRVIIIFSILAVMVAAVVLFYVPFIGEFPIAHTASVIVLAVIGIIVYRSYGRYYYRDHPQQQRGVTIFISSALTLLISMVTFNLVWGSPKPYLPYLWIPIILLVFIGAFLGNEVWKKIRST